MIRGIFRGPVVGLIRGSQIVHSNFHKSSTLSTSSININTNVKLEKEALDCLKKWGNAVAKRDKAAVLKMYANSSTLWPTLSNQLRQSELEKSQYFDNFLLKITGNVSWDHYKFQQINNNHCIMSGTYTFRLTTGVTQARFTYALVKQNDDWKILHHHSSLMPEA